MRIIPRIDIRNDSVIKGIHLEGVRRVGLPNPMVRRYAENGADEIIFMDVVASLYGRNKILSVVEEVAQNVFIPLTVGGGIRTIDDITEVLRSGADKVAINTAAIKSPQFLCKAARVFGSQCIVVSVEAKRLGNSWEAMTHNGREHTHRNVKDWVAEAEDLGAGEILVTSIDQEGTCRGFDAELFEMVHDVVKVPVIGCGGAGSLKDFSLIAEHRSVDAICCASIFHFDLLSMAEIKRTLAEAGAEVRL